MHGSLAAYGVFNHRHGAEIEQGMGREVTFTPHLIPIDRGILSTIYVRVAPGTTEDALADAYERAYRGATFVRLVGSSLPEIKHVAHTNFCDIGWRVDPSGRVILVSVIDNLLKGASGQAVQNLNVMLGLDERTGPAHDERDAGSRPGIKGTRSAFSFVLCVLRVEYTVMTTRPLVLKFGGELLEDRARLAARSPRQRDRRHRHRSSSCTAAARRSTPR